MSGKRSVNIQMASSAEGLKEQLDIIAKRRAVSVSKIVSQIYTYAVNNPGAFPKEIESPRSKPGKHISTSVPAPVADALTKWAIDLSRSRAHHCCFLLECVVDNQTLYKQIFN